MLPNGTRFHINDALYSSKSTRNFLSFKDIRRNGYHIKNMNEGNTKCLYITSIVSYKKLIMKNLSTFSFGLYHTNIKSIESYVIMNQSSITQNFYSLARQTRSPRSSMKRRIIKHSHEHPLKIQQILLPIEYSCVACSQGKLIVRPSFNKFTFESPVFLERIHGDICGSIHPTCGPLCSFMVLIDAYTR